MNRAAGQARIVGNVHVVDVTQSTERVRAGATALDVWAFLLPGLSFLQVTVVGQLIVSEILAALLLPWLWAAKERLKLPRWFVWLWAGWLVSQVATDLVMRSAFADYARGWAAIVFTMTDFLAILVLIATPRRARLFALGLAASGIAGYFVAPNLYAAADPWKWAFAAPIGFGLAAGLSGRVYVRMPTLPVAAFAAFGALNLLFGFRSLGGVALLTALYLFLGMLVTRGQATVRRSMGRAILGLLFCAMAALGILQGYDLAASQGLLGTRAQAEYLQQSSGSLGVLIGGRSDVLAATQAIIDSPIIGHGSWAKDFKYVDLLATRLTSLGYEIGAGSSDVGLIPAHSYMLGSWVWAGLLGGVFWAAMLLLAGWLLLNLYAVRLRLGPLLVFSSTLLLWNIVFSPYGSTARLLAAYGIGLCLLGLQALAGDERVPDEPDASAVSPSPTSNGQRISSLRRTAAAGSMGGGSK